MVRAWLHEPVTGRIRAGVAAIEGLQVLGEPDAHLIAVAASPGAPTPIDVFAVGDNLHERGWHLDRQGPPDSLHATVSPGNAPVVEQFVADLRDSVTVARASGSTGELTPYATAD